MKLAEEHKERLDSLTADQQEIAEAINLVEKNLTSVNQLCRTA